MQGYLETPKLRSHAQGYVLKQQRSSNQSRTLGDYHGHIFEAISQIQNYCEDIDEVSFLENRLIQDAVIRNFEIIGEASKNIERVAPEFVAAHPELPLAFAYDMRNLLAHGYYKVDVTVVWKTIERDLPYLQEQVTQAVRDLWTSVIAITKKFE